MNMNNNIYDVLKWIALILFPALGIAYSGLASLWGFPYATEITGSLDILGVFLGAVLQISSTKYKKNNL